MRSLLMSSAVFAATLSVPLPVSADATPVEIDAAVARISSGFYKVEFFIACGIATDTAQQEAVVQVVPILALQKDGLNKKLSNSQYVDAVLRATDKNLLSAMRARARTEATPQECEKPEHKELWESLVKVSKLLQKGS